jgi:hypothetical protein
MGVFPEVSKNGLFIFKEFVIIFKGFALVNKRIKQ